MNHKTSGKNEARRFELKHKQKSAPLARF